MKKAIFISAWVLFMLFAVTFAIGCALKEDKPVRICEPYIVEKGETLWSISEQFTKGNKTEWIYEVRQINNISGSIYAGETIYVFEEE